MVEVSMRTVSATNLRKDLFNYLDLVESGEVIIIQRNNQEVARLVPTGAGNWRDKMSAEVKLLVPAEDLIQPVEDIWEEYV
jgi:prevent-host-death family protein